MRLLVVFAIAVVSQAKPDGFGYSQGRRFTASKAIGADNYAPNIQTIDNYGASSSLGNDYSFNGFTGGYSTRGRSTSQGYGCGPGLIETTDGRCFPARLSKNIYLYESPDKQIIQGPPTIVPKGKLRENIIFIKTPEIIGSNDPIIIPPTQTKTTLYVLSKNGQQGQRTIQFAEGQQFAPEVFYVHYNDGENPVLPNGLDLESALASTGAKLGSSRGAYFGGIDGSLSGAVLSDEYAGAASESKSPSYERFEDLVAPDGRYEGAVNFH